MVRDICIVSMKDEYEIVCDLSNSDTDIADDLQWP